MRFDVLRTVPIEIWDNILDLACRTDPTGLTSRSLALVSRRMHELSQRSRYLTLALDGWEEVLGCDARFNASSPSSSSVGEQPERKPTQRKIVNLFVWIPSLGEVVYPRGEHGWLVRRDAVPEREDPSFVPPDSDDEGDDDDDEDEDEGGDDSPSSDSYEYSDPTPEEWENELNDAQTSSSTSSESTTRLSSYITSTFSETSLSFLLQYPTRIASSEYQVYSALRRILESCSNTLEVLHIHYTPHHEFFLEALFPVLPRLHTLYIYVNQRTFPGECPPSIYRADRVEYPHPHLQVQGAVDASKAGEVHDITTEPTSSQRPMLFPQVRTVEVVHTLSRVWLDYTFNDADGRGRVTSPEANIVHVWNPPLRETFRSRWGLRVEGKEVPALETMKLDFGL